MPSIPANSPANPPAGAWVVNTTAATFQQDVFERSRDLPVVVDFWAPWCGPCRALGPIIEKLAGAYNGGFLLVKANTDELSEAATQFNVSGIPAVYAVCDGQIVDFFSGALPEEQIRQWLDQVLATARLGKARSLEQRAPAEAEAVYRETLSAFPNHSDAKRGLARVLLAMGRADECRTLVRELEDHGYLDVEGQRLKATLELLGKQPSDLPARRSAAERDPANLSLQYQLAEGLAGAKEYGEALSILLSLVQRDKKGTGVQAKELMVQIFQAMPEDSELVSQYRRKLSMALY